MDRIKRLLFLFCLILGLVPFSSYGQSVNSFDLFHRLPKATADSLIKQPPQQLVVDSQLDSEAQGKFDIDTAALPSQTRSKAKEQKTTTPIAEDPGIVPQLLQEKGNLIFGTFILLALYLTVVISFKRSVVNEILRALLNDNYLNLLLRKLRSRGLSQFIFLYFFTIINSGLLIFLISEHFSSVNLDVNLLTISAVIGLIYLIRHAALTLLAQTYPIRKAILQFSFTILIFNLFLGLILFPLNLFIAFSPDIFKEYFIYSSLILIILFYISRQLRGLFIAMPYIFSYKFHFLLYLCTIEIAPLAVLYKFFQPYFS